MEDRVTPATLFQHLDAIRQASVAGKFFGQQIAGSKALDYNIPVIGDPLGSILQDSVVSTYDDLFTKVGRSIFEANQQYNANNDPDGLARIHAVTGIKLDGFDVRLMPSVADAGDIPKTGKNQVILARVDDVLYFRIFDASGDRIVDTNEGKLPLRAAEIKELKEGLEDLWGVKDLSRSDKDSVLALVAPVVTPDLPGTVQLVANDDGELSFKYTTTVANAYLASLARTNIREEFGLDKYLGELDLKGLSSRTLNLNPTITIEFGSIDAAGKGNFFLGGGALITGAQIGGTLKISDGSTVKLLGSDLTVDISGAQVPFHVTFNVGLGGEFDKFTGNQLDALGGQVKRGVGGFVDLDATFKAKLFGIPFIQWTPAIRFTLKDSGFDSPTDGNGITVGEDDASFDEDNKDDVGKAVVGPDPNTGVLSQDLFGVGGTKFGNFDLASTIGVPDEFAPLFNAVQKLYGEGFSPENFRDVIDGENGLRYAAATFTEADEPTKSGFFYDKEALLNFVRGKGQAGVDLVSYRYADRMKLAEEKIKINITEIPIYGIYYIGLGFDAAFDLKADYSIRVGVNTKGGVYIDQKETAFKVSSDAEVGFTARGRLFKVELLTNAKGKVGLVGNAFTTLKLQDGLNGGEDDGRIFIREVKPGAQIDAFAPINNLTDWLRDLITIEYGSSGAFVVSLEHETAEGKLLDIIPPEFRGKFADFVKDSGIPKLVQRGRELLDQAAVSTVDGLTNLATDPGEFYDDIFGNGDKPPRNVDAIRKLVEFTSGDFNATLISIARALDPNLIEGVKDVGSNYPGDLRTVWGSRSKPRDDQGKFGSDVENPADDTEGYLAERTGLGIEGEFDRLQLNYIYPLFDTTKPGTVQTKTRAQIDAASGGAGAKVPPPRFTATLSADGKTLTVRPNEALPGYATSVDTVRLLDIGGGKLRLEVTSEVGNRTYTDADRDFTAVDGFRVVVSTLGGNDILDVDPTLTFRVEADMGEGDDYARSGGGNDYLFGGDGEDTLIGGGGDDVIDVGNDTSTNYAYGDDEEGGAIGGQDTLLGGPGVDYLYGGGGNDTLRGFDGRDEIWGGAGADTIEGGAGDDTLYGEGENDTIFGGTGTDVIDGGAGNDTIIGGSYAEESAPTDDPGDSALVGGAGNDLLIAGNATGNLASPTPVRTANRLAVIFGGPGDDVIHGQSGQTTVNGRLVGDFLVGGGIAAPDAAGSDTIYAGGGNDFLFGGNVVYNGPGGTPATDQGSVSNSRMYGESGDDTLVAGSGNFLMDGGDNDDTFLISNPSLGIIDSPHRATILGGGGTNVALVTGGSRTRSGVLDADSSTADAGVLTLGGPGATHLGVDFSDLRAVTASVLDDLELITHNSRNEIAVDRPADGQNLISGTTHGVQITDLKVFSTTNLIIDTRTGNADSAFGDTITISSAGLVASNLKNFSVLTGPGNDSLTIHSPSFLLPVSGGTFVFNAGSGGSNLKGLISLDRIEANSNVNYTLTDDGLVSSGGGRIVLNGVEGAVLTGGPGNNTLDASRFSGPVVLNGGPGNDTLIGGAGNNILDGDEGNDTLIAGDDRFHTPGLGSQANVLQGGGGINLLRGGPGNDTLSASLFGTATLMGDGGDDLFIITNPAGAVMDPAGGLTIIGGGQPGDTLKLIGGGGTTYTTSSTWSGPTRRAPRRSSRPTASASRPTAPAPSCPASSRPSTTSTAGSSPRIITIPAGRRSRNSSGSLAWRPSTTRSGPTSSPSWAARRRTRSTWPRAPTWAPAGST